MPNEFGPQVGATQTTFKVIEQLSKTGQMGVTELSESANLPKSTTHKHLDTLRKLGYVVKTDGKYRLSLEFLGIGGKIREQMPIYQISLPEVRKLARETGETVNLVVEENNQGVILLRRHGDMAVTTDLDTGSSIPLHSTASGKLILSEMSAETLNDYISSTRLISNTENTITNVEQLKDELSKIRERGYAINDEERIRGVRSIAAPIRSSNSLLGVLSIDGPVKRMQDSRLKKELPETITKAANVIEVNLTYSG